MSNLTTASPAAAPNAAKKKRNLPGNPDPDAEVIALSPKSLMATNRFMCEICSKGFQRDQNLQLHRRGHNLPWKLKQRSSNDVTRKLKPVYVCPEASCVHHSPARALGDLTGIKKHFSRKHSGEKKYKCDKCDKKYAVHSDWKAHSKTCGTRDYTCDCGTIFSRRDSFITHRAFCDALAEENSKAIPPPLFSSSSSSSHDHDHDHDPPSTTVLLPKGTTTSLEQQQQHFNNAWLPTTSIDHHTTTTASNMYSSVVLLDHLDTAAAAAVPHKNTTSLSLPLPLPLPLANNKKYQLANSPHLSATALLQKAAQMGATMSRPGQTMAPPHSTSPTGIGFAKSPPILHEVMPMPMPMPMSHQDFMTRRKEGGGGGGGGGDGLTRDFLGLRALSHKDILSMAAAGLPCMTSSSSSSSFHH